MRVAPLVVGGVEAGAPGRWVRLLPVALLLGGCLSPLAALRQEHPLALGPVTAVVRSDGTSPEDVRRLAAAVERAQPALAAWGGLSHPLTLHVLPTHAALEQAVRRPGYAWLRAWAQYDSVLVQAPHTWTLRDDELAELVLHELTHCVLFQQSATAETWTRKRIPLWFREGMAIATAGQGARYPGLEDVAAWRAAAPELNPFTDGEALAETAWEPLYGLAHHAFAFLQRRYGQDAVRAVLARMREGARFDAAFTAAIGVTPKQFQRDFENYLTLRAFRGGPRALLPTHEARPPPPGEAVPPPG